LFFAKTRKNTSHLTPEIAADVRNMQKPMWPGLTIDIIGTNYQCRHQALIWVSERVGIGAYVNAKDFTQK
jgi:hypothetical protein